MEKKTNYIKELEECIEKRIKYNLPLPMVFRTNKIYIGFLPSTQYMHGTGINRFYIGLLHSTQ
jgi:hypothetical protein